MPTRKEMIEAILSNGDYAPEWARSREIWPIEYNVSLAHAGCLFDTLMEEYGGEYYDQYKKDKSGTPENISAIWMRKIVKRYKEIQANLWDWTVEEMRRELFDTDVYQTWPDGKKIDVKFSLEGRSGKHLVIKEFENFPLEGHSNENLATMLWRQENDTEDGLEYIDDEEELRPEFKWEFSDEEVSRLYEFTQLCDQWFSISAIKLTAETIMADILFTPIINEEEGD